MGISCFGFDVAGTWNATADTSDGKIDHSFVFHVEGTKLTGETSSKAFGKSVIENGKVEGDAISFTVTIRYQGEDMKFRFTGKPKGNDLEISVESVDSDFSTQYIARRAS